MLYCSLRRCLWTLTPDCGLWWCQCLDLSQTPLRLTSGCSLQSCKHNLWSEGFMILHQAWVWFLSPTDLPWFYWKVPGNWVSFLCSLRYINSQQRTIISSQRLSFPSSIYNLRWQNWLDCQEAKMNIFLLPVLWIVWNIFLLLLFALLLLFIRLHWIKIH